MKIFVAGPRAIRSLDNSIKDKLQSIYEKDHIVLVGDADGIDKAVQAFFLSIGYPKVIVYASNGLARHNLGKWPVEAIQVAEHTKGFAYYAAKDEAMASDADFGFMIWNGESKGTLNNVINLLRNEKKALVYFSSLHSFMTVDSMEKLDALLCSCDDKTRAMYEKLRGNQAPVKRQIALF